MRPPAARGRILRLHTLLSSPKGHPGTSPKPLQHSSQEELLRSKGSLWDPRPSGSLQSLRECVTLKTVLNSLTWHLSKCCTVARTEGCSNSGMGDNSVVKGAGRLPPGVMLAQKQQAWIQVTSRQEVENHRAYTEKQESWSLVLTPPLNHSLTNR